MLTADSKVNTTFFVIGLRFASRSFTAFLAEDDYLLATLY